MSNYLNPSILVNGIDNIVGRRIGWILVGVPASSKDSESDRLNEEQNSSAITTGNMPISDATIAGIMEPQEVTASSISNSALTLGNIGYFVAATDMPNAPLIQEEPSLENNETIEVIENSTDSNAVFNIAISNNNSLSAGSTTLFVRGITAQSTIFPAGIKQENKDRRYINIGSGMGKILLVLWKDEGISYDVKEGIAKDLANEYLNETNDYVQPSGSTVVNNYIDKVLFSYDVAASENKCNDWNYTGFSVGNIKVALTGLSS